MTAPESADRAVDRRPAMLLSSLLLLAGVLVGVSPLLGIVTTADSSPTVVSLMASFIALLPGVLAVTLATRRPVLALAATAGAGVIGLVRVLTDLAVLTETDRITRPELFAETTVTARPLSAAAGAWLLLAADLLWLVVGILAAARLAAVVSPVRDGGTERIFGRADPAEPDVTDPEPAAAGVDGDPVAEALSQAAPDRRPLNLPMVTTGFVGAVLLMVGALGTPYSGGYLDLRVLPFGSSVSGLVAAALLGFLAAVAVLVAAGLPAAPGQALLAGTGLAAAVPSLTAVVAVLTGAPTSLSPVVWCGIAGSAIVAGSGFIPRRPAAGGLLDDPEGTPPQAWLTMGTGGLALLGAALLFGASRSALLYLDGGPPDELTGLALAPAGPPALVAAIPLGVAGVLAMVRPVERIGRAALTVVWAGAVYAFGQAFFVRSLVLSTVGDAAANQHSWTAGPGQWLLLAGTALALGAAALAIVTGRRDEQASLDVVDDDSLESSRAARRWPAAALTALVVLALAVPAHSDLTGAGPTLLHGYDLDTWGFWALALGAVGGTWAAALTRRPQLAAAWLIAAAVVVGQPLLIPAAARAVAGFQLSAGFWVGIAAVVALLCAAGYFAVMAGRVLTLDQPPLRAVGRGATGRARSESKGR